jgi:hypothetical protein
MTFDNEEQLKKFILKKCEKAVDGAKRRVHAEFAGNLNQFYMEYSPEYYIRTGELFNSLDSTDATRADNGAWAEVYFNTPSYQNGDVLLQDGSFGYANWSGEKVLYVALKGVMPHGGWAGGTEIWTDTMESLGERDGIKNILKEELKKQGL